MKKFLAIAFALAALAALALANPAHADHGVEGTVTVAGVATCSNDTDTPGDGLCTWTSTDPNGWIGQGPFTVSWVTGDPADGVGDGSFTCGAGQTCDSTQAESDPIPAGATVTSDGSAGGTFAAGDADQHDGA